MSKDEEADADDLASEFETDRTRKKIRRNLVKFRRSTAAIKLKKIEDLCISLFVHISGVDPG